MWRKAMSKKDRAVSSELKIQGETILNLLNIEEKKLDNMYNKLAAYASNEKIPAEFKDEILTEIQSLNDIEKDFKKAHIKSLEMKDELESRYKDVEKSLNKKWYKTNPPSNTEIDYEENKSNHFAKGINFYKSSLVLFAGSLAGVVIELLWCMLTKGYVQSRSGLVYGPFNLLYGVGAAVLSIALYDLRNRNRILCFLGGMFIGSIVEYGCSFFQEMFFGSVSWDYSHMPFNLNGRICLFYSLMWGVLGLVWIKNIYPRMSKWILKIPNNFGKVLTVLLVVFLLFDGIISAMAVKRWSDRMKGINASGSLQTYLDKAFPDEKMKSIYANMEFGENKKR
jgi:hypothetical protein